MLSTMIRGCREDRLFSEAHSDMTRGHKYKLRHGKFLLDVKKKEFTVRIPEREFPERAQRGKVSIPGESQNLTGQGPEQPHLVGLVLSRRLDQMMSLRSPPT